MGFGGFDKIVQPAIRRIRPNSAIVWSHRHPEFFWMPALSGLLVMSWKPASP
jgi:hypothetical protein